MTDHPTRLTGLLTLAIGVLIAMTVGVVVMDSMFTAMAQGPQNPELGGPAFGFETFKTFLLLNVVVVAAAITMRFLTGSVDASRGRLDELKDRYVQGEIDMLEYENRVYAYWEEESELAVEHE